MKKVTGYFSCRPLGCYDFEFMLTMMQQIKKFKIRLMNSLKFLLISMLKKDMKLKLLQFIKREINNLSFFLIKNNLLYGGVNV